MTETVTVPEAQWRVDLEDYVSVLEVSPSLHHAVAGSLGGDVALVDVNDGSSTTLQRHEMGALNAAWSHDGSRIAVGGHDEHVHIYDPTGTPIGDVEVSEWVTALAWSPKEHLLAIGAGRRLIIADHNGTVLYDFDDQPSTVMAVAWSPDGSRVGVAAYGGVGWHDVSGPRSGGRKRFDWTGSLLALVVSPDGKWACAGAQDSTVQIWKLWSGKDLTMSGYQSKIERIAFRGDSRWFAVACLDELTVWDFGGRGPSGTAPASASEHNNHIEDLAWAPSGDYLATGGGDGRTIVWPSPTKAGQDLSPLAVLESDASTSRLRWVGEDSFLTGRADGGLVRIQL